VAFQWGSWGLASNLPSLPRRPHTAGRLELGEVIMREQVPVDPHALAEASDEGNFHELLPELAYQRLLIVNVVYHGTVGARSGGWVLIDAGIPGSARMILNVVERRFGKGSRPAAIVLTHGHFDHVG